MNEAQAWELVTRLAIETNGWDDLKIEATAKRLEGLADPYAAAQAIETVIETHDTPGRPPWASVRLAYNAAVRHKTMTAPTQIASGATVSFAEGRQIAARAYARQCASRPDDDTHIVSGFRTNEPNMVMFDRMLGLEPDGF